jgi:uncharacterized membrane protein SpoIIM required for sporulation
MTPLQFEQRWRAEWDELAALLDTASGVRPPRGAEGGFAEPPPSRLVRAERLALLYRRVCEHLALARARAYPAPLIAQLDALTHRAHQEVYAGAGRGWRQLVRLYALDVPRMVRRQARYVALAGAVFFGPLVAMALITWWQPSFALSVISASQLQEFDFMYGEADSIGRVRSADNDWSMFGFYIFNNIRIGFQCFAGGLLAGLGSLFFLGYNGLHIGVVAGYLTERGLGEAFWSFVATHSSFELIAIVLSGAAGLRLGHALLAPGRRTRIEALKLAAREAIVVVYGVIALLVIAAAIEAFWSSARWVPAPVKYATGIAGWLLVLAWLLGAGRRRERRG